MSPELVIWDSASLHSEGAYDYFGLVMLGYPVEGKTDPRRGGEPMHILAAELCISRLPNRSHSSAMSDYPASNVGAGARLLRDLDAQHNRAGFFREVCSTPYRGARYQQRTDSIRRREPLC